jgi:competence protein ComEA
VRPTSRRSDDTDVIRARLRALLDEARRPGGWLPDDLPDEEEDADESWADPDSVPTVPVHAAGPAEEAGLPIGLGRHRAPDRTARWDPGLRGGRSLWLAGLVAAVVVAGWTWLHRPQVEPVPADPVHAATETPAAPSVGEVAETSSTVVVSVVGLVARPGLVTLPSGARVAAAIEAAGGLLPDADPGSVNLAAVVADGQQIAVGVPGTSGPAPGGGATASPAPGSGGLVDLNAAGAADLDALPGIGPVLAQRIVDFRTRNGPFTSVDQLDDVPGIGPAIFAQLTSLVTV